MRAILILLAILVGAIVLIRSTKKKPKQASQEENFSGLVDGAANVASSLTILVFVVVGVIIVVALVLVKKATQNPDRAFEVAGKGVDIYSKIKKA